MKIETIILSHDYSPCFISRDEIDYDILLNGVKSRQELAIKNGENWTKDGISVFGLAVIKAVNSGEHHDLSKAIAELAIIIMIHEITFQNIDPNIFRNCKMKLTIDQGGLVIKKSEYL